jgi:glucan phosphoethanolaminetransferase (alkaline phosphatase superfamily)
MADGRQRALTSFAAEAAAWGTLVGLFLAAYIRTSSGSMATVAPHLQVVLASLIALWSLRLAAWLVLPRGNAVLLGGLLLGLPFVALGAYYAAVLVGHDSWGRVISWPLIKTYALELPVLATSLGIHPWLATTALVLLGLLGWGIAVIATRTDWLWAICRGTSRTVSWVLCAGGLAYAGLSSYDFTIVPPVHAGEPLSLTLYPTLGRASLQTHRTAESGSARAAAEADRATYEPAAAPTRRNVVLVVADALRADRLSVYGYGRQTTPFLDEQMKLGRMQVAERMAAVCAESSCGLLAIARSKYLHEFSSSDFSLYEVLQRNGWTVRLVLSGDHTNFYGLRAAYGRVDSYADGATAGSGYSMNDDRLVLRQLADLPDWEGKPSFIQLHLMSSHPLGVRHDEYKAFLPASPYVVKGQLRWAGSRGPIEEASNFYDNGVVQTDAMLRRALALLESKGYLKDALVILTGDHGEMLGERGDFGHAKGVDETVLRVPFVMLHYGHRPARAIAARQKASQVDIAPTILAELAIPQPRTWQGRAMAEAGADRLVFFQQGWEVGLYDFRASGQRYKYVRNARTGVERVFDPVQDPYGTMDLAGTVARGQLTEWRLEVAPIVSAVGH